MHLPRESLRALFRGLTQPCLRIFQNILASFDRARYWDINTRERIFKCISSPGRYGRTRIRQKCQSCRASNCFACHRRRRAGRCALVFHRITYLSIPRRTIEFNEVEIENTTRTCGIRLINAVLRLETTVTLRVAWLTFFAVLCCGYGLCLIELAQKSNSTLLWLFNTTMSNRRRQ